MNARIDMYSPDEVAKSVGVTGATICNWCRDGIINCNNVSDGSVNARYEIPEDEYRYLRDLARKYGPKKVLSVYNKNWRDSDMNTNELDPNKEYSSIEASNILGVNHDGLNKHCKRGDFNCRVEKTARKRYFAYFIPGWELIYLKELYDKYGRQGGRDSALKHYIKNRDKRPGYVPELIYERSENSEVIGDAMVEETENGLNVTATKEFPGYTYCPSESEDEDDKILNRIVKIKDLKRDIEDYETKLNQMRNEYKQLKEELIEWL